MGVSRAAVKDHAAWGTSGRYPFCGLSVLKHRARETDRDRDRRDRGRGAARRADLDVPQPLELAPRPAAGDRLEDAVAGFADDMRRVAQPGGEEPPRHDLDGGPG
jgi:hypothetical protein